MTCHGCGAPLPPNKAPGRPRKWCSEQCRKITLYSRECVDCGAVCNTDGRVTNAATRCASCQRRGIGDAHAAAARARAKRMLALRLEGLTNRQIAAMFDMQESAVSRSLGRLRGQGVDVPVSPWWTRATS